MHNLLKVGQAAWEAGVDEPGSHACEPPMSSRGAGRQSRGVPAQTKSSQARGLCCPELLSLDGVAEDPNSFFVDWDKETDADGAALIVTQDAVMGDPRHNAAAIEGDLVEVRGEPERSVRVRHRDGSILVAQPRLGRGAVDESRLISRRSSRAKAEKERGT